MSGGVLLPPKIILLLLQPSNPSGSSIHNKREPRYQEYPLCRILGIFALDRNYRPSLKPPIVSTEELLPGARSSFVQNTASYGWLTSHSGLVLWSRYFGILHANVSN